MNPTIFFWGGEVKEPGFLNQVPTLGQQDVRLRMQGLRALRGWASSWGCKKSLTQSPVRMMQGVGGLGLTGCVVKTDSIPLAPAK